MSWAEPRAFPHDELVFFGRVADQLALAIRGARLYGNLQSQLEALALEQRRRELADRDRSRLTAMLVHDMKNPLSALSAALELTRDKERRAGDERLAKLLDGSLASARGLQGLIEDALLVYRPGDAPETERRPASVAGGARACRSRRRGGWPCRAASPSRWTSRRTSRPCGSTRRCSEAPRRISSGTP